MRPTLKAITVSYELNGQVFQQEVELEHAVALFWEGDSMGGILSAYYQAKGRKLGVKQAVEGFGPQAAQLFKKRKKRVVTKSLLRALWNLPRPLAGHPPAPPPGEPGHAMEPKAMMAPSGGLEPLMVIKDPNCKLRAFL